MLPARMRTSAGWSDACILNLSSRGLMVHANFSALAGGDVEVWHRELAISARIVWREGGRAGLEAEDRIPVEEILSIASSASLQVSAAARGAERRKRRRTHDDSRVLGRSVEFVSIAVITVALALGFSSLVGRALALPLGSVTTELQG